MALASLLLPLSLTAAPAIIQEVNVTPATDGIRVDVVADGGAIPRAAGRVVVNGNAAYLYVADTHVRADHRSWDNEGGAVQAHRHRKETELVVPLGGRHCAGGAVESTEDGLSAVIHCDAASGAAAVAVDGEQAADPIDVPVRAARKAKAFTTAPEKAPAKVASPAAAVAPVPAASDVESSKSGSPKVEPAVKAEGPADNASLKTLVALPPDDDTDPKLAKSAPPTEATPAVAKAAPSPTPAPATESSVDTPHGDASGHGGGRAPWEIGALLLGLAVGAFFWSRKRGKRAPRAIQILETVSLGPKRSLVVAEVDGQRLILGTSEAGITLLKTEGGKELGFPAVAAVSAAETASPARGRDVAAPAMPDKDAAFAPMDVDGDAEAMEGSAAGLGGLRALSGGLSRMFRRDTEDPTMPVGEDLPPLRSAFADMLSDGLGDDLVDSDEDQELRRKLAAGVSGRVP